MLYVTRQTFNSFSFVSFTLLHTLFHTIRNCQPKLNIGLYVCMYVCMYVSVYLSGMSIGNTNLLTSLENCTTFFLDPLKKLFAYFEIMLFFLLLYFAFDPKIHQFQSYRRCTEYIFSSYILENLTWYSPRPLLKSFFFCSKSLSIRDFKINVCVCVIF